jgi:CspA family cold shock protein
LTVRLVRPLDLLRNVPIVAGLHAAPGIRFLSKDHQMVEGTVKFFNTTKGFGFIEPNGGGKDAFVHISAVERAGLGTLHEGQKVSYELETGRDGKQSATNLQAL